MEELRQMIDKVDEQIIRLLIAREELVEKIGKLKKEGGIEILDRKREDEIKEKIKQKCKELGVEYNFVLGIFEKILKKSKEIQK